MKRDPRRKDTCAQCGGPLPVIKPQRGVDPKMYMGDPFCSARCCRTWHDVPETVMGGDPQEKRGRWQRKAA